jgi:hypothetical protein
MTQKNAAQEALTKARNSVNGGPNRGVTQFLALADVEVRAEQAKQQEIANLIAMLATPAACPFPATVVHARIKELANLG